MGSALIFGWVQLAVHVYDATRQAKVVGVICTQRLYAGSATAS